MSIADSLEVIGVVRSGRTATESTPIQAALNLHEQGRVEVYAPFADALVGLEEFDYVWLLTWLHRPDMPGRPVPLTQVPFLLRRSGARWGSSLPAVLGGSTRSA